MASSQPYWDQYDEMNRWAQTQSHRCIPNNTVLMELHWTVDILASHWTRKLFKAWKWCTEFLLYCWMYQNGPRVLKDSSPICYSMYFSFGADYTVKTHQQDLTSVGFESKCLNLKYSSRAERGRDGGKEGRKHVSHSLVTVCSLPPRRMFFRKFRRL